MCFKKYCGNIFEWDLILKVSSKEMYLYNRNLNLIDGLKIITFLNFLDIAAIRCANFNINLTHYVHFFSNRTMQRIYTFVTNIERLLKSRKQAQTNAYTFITIMCNGFWFSIKFSRPSPNRIASLRILDPLVLIEIWQFPAGCPY